MDFFNIREVDYLAFLGAALLVILCCYPIASFAKRGWKIRRDDILSNFNTKAKEIYLKTYLNYTHPNDPDKVFDEIYTHRYGRRRLIVPTVLLVLILFPLMFVVCETAVNRLIFSFNAPHVLVAMPGLATAGILGSYLWIVADLIVKSRRNDLSSSIILLSALRISIAAPLGYAISHLVASSLGPFVAFSIGAFPVDTISTLLKKTATQKLGIEMSINDDKNSQTKSLDGVDSLAADILEDVNITTIAQLAYCDPVQVAMRTGFSFSFVVDIVGQALAFIYLGEKLSTLRLGGLRSATEIYNLWENLNGNDKEKKVADSCLEELAKLINLTPNVLRNTCDEIANDPHTTFLVETWNT